MNKKILIIMLIAIFLVTSVGVISAADSSNSIPVKIVWNDADDAPSFVVVNLLKDGKVVDTAKLSAANSWKTTFKVDDDGSYQVKEVISDDYSYKIDGDANKGFVIKNDLVTDEELDVLDGDSMTDDVLGAEDESADGEDSEIDEDDSSEDTLDGNDTEDSNSTDNSTDDSTDGADDSDDDSDDSTGTDDDSDDEMTTTSTKTTTTTKIIKQDKKPVNTTSKHKNTGFPIVVLVIAVFVAAFIPLSRRK